MKTSHLDTLSLLLQALLLLLGVAATGWVVACVFFSSMVLSVLGGSFLMYALLFVAGLAVLGGSVFLLTRLNAWKTAAVGVEVAPLRAQPVATDRVHFQSLAELEEKRAQLEAEKAEVRNLEAKIAEREIKAAAQLAAAEEQDAEAAARLAAATTRLAAVEEKEKRFMIEERRFKAWQRQAAIEKVEWRAELARVKAQHGDALPQEERDRLCDDLDRRFEAEDPPLFWGMFRNPLGFTETPKPLRRPDNPLQRSLEKGVEAGLIDATVLEDEDQGVICSITKEVMQKPVKGEDGRWYDQHYLEHIYCTSGTYPFNRQEMTIDPAELPCDQACLAKIQQLAQQCRAEVFSSEDAEEPVHSSSLRISVI